jgi:hypothetical protein
MKRKNLIISIIALAGALASIVSAAHAIKLCQLDWFNAWKTAGGALQNSRRAYTRGNYDNSTGNGGGTWSVTSDQGSDTVYHTVSGISFCSTSGSGAGPYTDGSPGFDTGTSSNNTNCWCRMTAPNLGASWVFLNAYGSAAFARATARAAARIASGTARSARALARPSSRCPHRPCRGMTPDAPREA